MPDQNILTLQQADQARTDFALIESHLEFISAQLARRPTRRDLAGTALGIILHGRRYHSLRMGRVALAKGARGAKLNAPLDLGGNVDARHYCDMCRLGSSIDNFGASRPLAPERSRSNRTHYFPYRASGRLMRLRISAHPLAGSVGPLALGPLRFKDA
jgi:hypothetical protein